MEHHVINHLECLICHIIEETYEHLFLRSEFAKAVWFGMPIGFTSSELDTHVRIIYFRNNISDCTY